MNLIEADPREAIGACWQSVNAAVNAAGARHLPHFHSSSAETGARELAGKGILDPSLVRATRALYQAWIQARAFPDQVTSEMARGYAETAHATVVTIQSQAEHYEPPEKKKK